MQRTLKWSGVAAVLLGIAALALGCATNSTTTAPAQSSSPTTAAAGPFSVTDTQITTAHNPLTLSQIANIQPGLGTVMIEYGIRFNNLWFAAQNSNWNMVSYQIDEMREIQEVGEITRSNRATMLKGFESSFLDPLAKAASNKDLTGFKTAYDGAIGGCNACHAASSGKAADGSPIPSYKFVKIIRPTAPDFNNVDFAGQ
jgi:hypothetical protein